MAPLEKPFKETHATFYGIIQQDKNTHHLLSSYIIPTLWSLVYYYLLRNGCQKRPICYNGKIKRDFFVSHIFYLTLVTRKVGILWSFVSTHSSIASPAICSCMFLDYETKMKNITRSEMCHCSWDMWVVFRMFSEDTSELDGAVLHWCILCITKF